MRKLSVFNFITLDGYYKAPNGDISWHRHGGEESEYSAQSLATGNMLLFGRVTYEMMAGFWSSDAAYQQFPVVASGMNYAEKIVFSRTIEKADWKNTRLIKDNIVEEIKQLKQTPGKNMTILGSGSILTQFAAYSLIDEYQFMIDPVVLGNGVSIFKGMTHKLDLELTATRTFKSGTVLITYKPR